MAEEKVILDLQVKVGDALDAIVKTKEQLASLRKEQKELEKDLRSGKGSEDMRNRLKEITGEISQLNNVLRVNQKELDQQVKLQSTQTDSIKAMRIELQQMRGEYENLSASERNSSNGVALQEQILKYTENLKELERAQGDFTRGVGEYERALNGNARQALRDMQIECQNLAVSLNGLKGQITAQTEVVSMMASKYGTSSVEYKKAADELSHLQGVYEKTSVSLKEMEQRTGELSDVINDSRQRVASFANDQQKLVAAQEGVNALTGAYNSLQGAFALLGKENKALIEIYAKMQIVQRSVNGLLTVYKTLNRDSNFMIVAKQKLEKLQLFWQRSYNQALTQTNVLTKANTNAIIVDTTAKRAATATTVSFTTAIKAMGIALKSNPLTAIAAAGVAAITALSGVIKRFVNNKRELEASTKETLERAKEAELAYTNELKERANAYKQTSSAIDNELVKIDALTRVVKSETASYYEKERALNVLNKLVPEYNGLINKTTNAVKGNEKALGDYIKSLNERAKQEVAIEALKEQQLELLTLKRQKKMAEDDQKWYQQQLNRLKDYESALMSGGSYDEVVKVSPQIEWYTKKLLQTDNVIQGLVKTINSTNKSIDYTISSIDSIDFVNINRQVSTTTNNVNNAKTALDEFNKSVENNKNTTDVNVLTKLLQDADALKEKFPELTTELNKLTIGLQNQTLESFGDLLNQDTQIPEVEKITTYYDGLIGKLEELKELYPDIYDGVDTLIGQFNEAKNTDITSSLTQTQEKVNEIVKSLKSFNIFEQYKNDIQKLNDEELKSLENINLTEEQKEQIREAYRVKRLENERKLQEDIRSLEMGLNTNNGGIFAKIEQEKVSQIKAAEDIRNLLLQNDELTYDERLALEQQFQNKRAEIENEAVKQTINTSLNTFAMMGDSVNALIGSMGDLFSELAGDNEEYQKYANAMALTQMAIQMATGIASATAQAMTIPFPANIAAAVAGVATVVAAITTAIAQIKKNKVKAAPKFAEGGLVGNKLTNRSDDTIPAYLSEGEYVMRSAAVKSIGLEKLDSMNTTGKITDVGIDYDRLASAISDVNISVSVREINDVQNRIKLKENY